MFETFLISLGRLIAFSAQALTRPPLGMRRLLIMLLFIPLFAVVQLIHWLGLLLDEVLFPGYRDVTIEKPLFVLGVPRSGTTQVHSVLARDPGFTTFSTWECLFAPSVTARRFWLTLGRLDRSIGSPFTRLIGLVEKGVFSSMDDVHPMSLSTPEEDYFALMPVMSCFILFLPFPRAEHLWRMGSFDRDMPERERRRLLSFYRSCLQRHLYVHGSHKRLLSKNAAFAPLALSLAETFPDARFLTCLRDPLQTVPSQLSSIRSGQTWFGLDPDEPEIHERFIGQLAFYYDNLAKLHRQLPVGQSAQLGLGEIKSDLAGAVTRTYAQFGIELAPDFEQALQRESDSARGYRSGHRYGLADFGLDEQILRERFAHAYAMPPLSPTANAGADTKNSVARQPTAAPRSGSLPTKETLI